MKLIISIIFFFSFVALNCYGQENANKCENVKCAKPDNCPDNSVLVKDDCCAICVPGKHMSLGKVGFNFFLFFYNSV